MMKFKTLDDLSPRGKTVLLRADLNVPMQDGQVSDMTRITRLLPTIRELSAKGAKVVLLSHFGRPKGRDVAFSLAPVGKALGIALGKNIPFVDDCIGAAPAAAIAKMKEGEVILLENVRFYAEEEKDDAGFAAKIAALGDIYVNDAFSAAHRAHATTHGIAHLLPAYAGRLMEAEIRALDKALGNPQRPVVAIVGGAKISTKLDLLNNLVGRIDTLVLGGGMANTFLHAIGTSVGKSLCEREMAPQALQIIATAKAKDCKIILPVDGVVARELKAGVETETVGIDSIPADGMVLDIGRGSVAVIADELRKAKTVLWNGPLGAFEIPPFDAGTTALAKVVAELTAQGKLLSVAGGGDTVSALAHAGVEEKMTYVSTAGGAFLEWMEGKELPGVKALAG
ncbi:MAG: phosphoglycerate kinase [Alphaproteobacteria bacterium]|nr:phosphoglycerate kinase [Alphaproteobacteria bacterium]